MVCDAVADIDDVSEVVDVAVMVRVTDVLKELYAESVGVVVVEVDSEAVEERMLEYVGDVVDVKVLLSDWVGVGV